MVVAASEQPAPVAEPVAAQAPSCDAAAGRPCGPATAAPRPPGSKPWLGGARLNGRKKASGAPNQGPAVPSGRWQ